MWNGELICESTKQGNDRKARNIEAAHRARLAMQRDASQQAKERMKCSAVLLCEECEKWFNAEEAQRRDTGGLEGLRALLPASLGTDHAC